MEQGAEHAPAELILNARAYRRPRNVTSPTAAAAPAPPPPPTIGSATPRPLIAMTAASTASDVARVGAVAGGGGGGGGVVTLDVEEVEVGGLLMKLALPNSACCRELAQLLHGLSERA